MSHSASPPFSGSAVLPHFAEGRVQYWDGDKRVRPQRPDKTIANHRQKRNGRRISKRIGIKTTRIRFKRDLEPTTSTSLVRLYGGFSDSPMYGHEYRQFSVDALLLRDTSYREHYRQRGYRDVSYRHTKLGRADE
jgi:hypothetical protein